MFITAARLLSLQVDPALCLPVHRPWSGHTRDTTPPPGPLTPALPGFREGRPFLPGLESSGQTSLTLQEDSPAQPLKHPPPFLSGCFEGEKCSQERGPSSAVTVMWGEDRRGTSGSDPPGPPGPPGEWWLLTPLTPDPRPPTLTPVLQILLQPVPQHL